MEWINYEAYKFEKLYQDLLKANYYMIQHGDASIEELLIQLHNEPESLKVYPLTQEECFKSKGIKQQIEDGDIKIPLRAALTIESFNMYLDALIKEHNMKQKLILHNNAVDKDMYFDSYESLAKHLDTKVSRLKKVTNTGEVINYIYTINTK